MGYYCRRIVRIVRLLIIRLLMGKKIETTDKIQKYNLSCDTRLRINGNGKITMGAFSTEMNVHLSAQGGVIRIDSGCAINRNCIIVAKNRIEIGKNTIIAPNVCIYDHDHVFNESGPVPGEYRETPIHIGRNVWIGTGVIILRGTTIGDHSIIGAGCVVHGVIPENSLVTSSSRELKIKNLAKMPYRR